MTMDVRCRPVKCVVTNVKQVLLPCAGLLRVSIILIPGYQAHASQTNKLGDIYTVDRVWVSKMLETHIKTLSPSNDFHRFFLERWLSGNGCQIFMSLEFTRWGWETALQCRTILQPIRQWTMPS
jgi:hypothetical protein